jgi:hypothetical protein
MSHVRNCYLLVWLISISRILISQDHEQIYVTLAEYQVTYIRYLKKQVDFENAPFLLMTTYGPFMTTESGNMGWLGAILRVLLPYAATHRPRRDLSPSHVPRTPSPVGIQATAVNPLLAGAGKGGKQREEGQDLKSKREPSPLKRTDGDSTSSDGGGPVSKIDLPNPTSDGKKKGGDPTLRPRMSLGSLRDIQYNKAASEPAEQSTSRAPSEQERGRQPPQIGSQKGMQKDTSKGKKKKK